MGNNLNRFVQNVDKFKLNPMQLGEIEKIVDRNFNLLCLRLIDLSQKKWKEPKLMIQKTCLGKR